MRLRPSTIVPRVQNPRRALVQAMYLPLETHLGRRWITNADLHKFFSESQAVVEEHGYSMGYGFSSVSLFGPVDNTLYKDMVFLEGVENINNYDPQDYQQNVRRIPEPTSDTPGAYILPTLDIGFFSRKNGLHEDSNRRIAKSFWKNETVGNSPARRVLEDLDPVIRKVANEIPN